MLPTSRFLLRRKIRRTQFYSLGLFEQVFGVVTPLIPEEPRNYPPRLARDQSNCARRAEGEGVGEEVSARRPAVQASARNNGKRNGMFQTLLHRAFSGGVVEGGKVSRLAPACFARLTFGVCGIYFSAYDCPWEIGFRLARHCEAEMTVFQTVHNPNERQSTCCLTRLRASRRVLFVFSFMECITFRDTRYVYSG